MSYSVKMIMNNFAKVHKHVFLDLNFRNLVDLNSRGVHDSEIYYEILTLLANYH